MLAQILVFWRVHADRAPPAERRHLRLAGDRGVHRGRRDFAESHAPEIVAGKDRKRGGEGKRGDFGGRRILKKKKETEREGVVATKNVSRGEIGIRHEFYV